MLKTKFELAKEVVDQYNHAFLQGDTFLHIQEWLDEQAKEESKKEYIKIDEDGNVLDIDKKLFEYCASCGSKIKYHNDDGFKQFIF